MLNADMLYHMLRTINKKVNNLTNLTDILTQAIKEKNLSYICENCQSEEYIVDKSFRSNGHMYRYAHCKHCNTRVKQEIINRYVTREGDNSEQSHDNI